MTLGLCIVIPVLDEGERLLLALRDLQPFRQRGARVVVVDGGSSDNTLAIAREHADLALVALRGRASQMNAGAAACGDAAAGAAQVLLFLHADTRLPDNADTLVHRATLAPQSWGRFDVQIDSPALMLRIVSGAMNLRSRWTGIATGDQAMFVRQDLFIAAGGFPDIPLMEDIALSATLKKYGPPVCLRQRVITSARRWQRHGVWRTIWLMWRLRAAYFFGADPAQLAIDYGYQPAKS
jgi:rSAM/selenodomain-associated transferase 2